jgi:hypothetical protein
LYAHGFRVYFTPLTGVLFAFPSRYWFTIGQSGVFSLGGWSPRVQTRFLVPRPTRFHQVKVSDTGLSPTMAALSSAFSYLSPDLRANPRSLAATEGISVDFFSSGYLDVSVPRVRLCTLWIQVQIPGRNQVGFPIRTCPDHSSFASSPNLFAGFNVLHRL